ncbi:MAG: enoyl-CoA hydratase/isomerase family protein [Acidobacteriaceae bacterium]
MGEFTTLETNRQKGILRVTLNRPEKRNALSPQMIEELTAALRGAGEDARCGVVVLTGSGPAFCAGLDLDHLESLENRSAAEHREDSERIAGLFRALYDCPRPTIAAVNGAAIAGGCGIATLCDFTLAVPRAKFGYTEVRIGFIPAIVSTFLLAQVGEKQARDLLLTGRIFEAAEAYALGLVNEVVEPEDLLPAAERLAGQLLANSPEALAATKRLLSANAGAALDGEMETAIQANADARLTGDFREGIRAFLEKRAPKWPSLKIED